MIQMNSIEAALDKVRRAGNLPIIAYTILGYPDMHTSIAALEILKENGVAAFETAAPFLKHHSCDLSVPIRKAHVTGASQGITLKHVLSVYAEYRPNVYVVHEGSPWMELDTLAKRLSDKIDAVLLGWRPQALARSYEACHNHGIGLVNPVSTSDSPRELARVLRYNDGFVYLQAAPSTGGHLYDTKAISDTATAVRAIRASLPICCGFGVRTPHDLQTLGSLPECDGVVIGTALLEALANGIEQFKFFVTELTSAAKGLKNQEEAP